MRLDPEKRKAIRRLALVDYLTALVAWMLFWAYRYEWLGKASFSEAWSRMTAIDLLEGLLLIPLACL